MSVTGDDTQIACIYISGKALEEYDALYWAYYY